MTPKILTDNPLRGEPFVKPVLINDCDFMIVTDYPDRHDLAAGEPFPDIEGSAGEVLWSVLKDLNEDVVISLDYVVKNRIPEGMTFTKKVYTPYLPGLFREIKRCNPKLLILLGKNTLKAVLGVNTGVSKLNGKLLTEVPAELKDIPTLVCFHPDYVVNSKVPAKSRAQFEKGLLPALHFFDEETDFKWQVVKKFPELKGIVALDIESTGLRPCGTDCIERQIFKHTGIMRCVGIADGKKVYYADVEDKT